MSYIRGLGAIETSPCTQNPNDPVCKELATSPTTGDPWSNTAAEGGATGIVNQISDAIGRFFTAATPPPAPGVPAPKSRLPLLVVGGAIALAAFLLLRKPKSNPSRRRRRHRRRRRNGDTYTVVLPNGRRITGYTSWKQASFAGQMFGGPFSIVRGNPRTFTRKGERMYRAIKRGYGKRRRAKEIAARTVYARSRTTPGLVKKRRKRRR